MGSNIAKANNTFIFALADAFKKSNM